MAVPRSVRIGCCFLFVLIPWFFVSRYFWRFFDTSSDDLWQSLLSASYIPILAFLATFLIRRWNQRVVERQDLTADPTTKDGSADRWIALALMLAGTASAVSWWGWISTRSLQPLEMPISLSRGNIRTNEFVINVPSKYSVYVEVDRKPDFDNLDCLVGFGGDRCKATPSVLDVSWKLTQSGETVAEGGAKSDPRTFETRKALDRGLGVFTVTEAGRFVLDVEVLGDSSQLNAANPRLGVAEQGGMYWEFRSQTGLVLGICAFAVLFGFFLWVRSSSTSASSPEAIEPPSLGAKRRFPGQIWIGAVMLVVGLPTFIGVYRWMSSRTFVPLNMPISLAKGRIRTEPFKINLSGDYGVRIYTGWQCYFDPDCPSYDRVKAHWVLYKDGEVAAKWLDYDPYTYLGGFYGEPGTYVLDLDVLSETSCLNPGHPRLVILTDREPYEGRSAMVLWVSAFLIALGTSLVILGLVGTSASTPLAGTRITDLQSVGQNFQWAQKLPLRKKFSLPPAFALLVTPSAFVLMAFYMIFLAPIPSRGLYVDLVKPGSPAAPNDPFNQPVLVQLVDAGPGKAAKLFVNSKPTTWQDLSSALKGELRSRPRWVVQVEGDENVAWVDAINVMDVAKSLSAKVVMLTSKPTVTPPPDRKAGKSSKR